MTSEEITTRLNAGEEAISTGDFDRAEALAAELLSLDTINNYRYHALRIQSIASMQRGDFTRALAYGNEALEACEAAGDPIDCAELTGIIGSIYRQLSNYSKALEYYTRALALCEEFDIPSGIIRFTGNIGLVHFNLEDYPKALEYLHRTYSAYEQSDMKEGAATALGNIGVIYEHLAEYATALEYYTKALRLSEELDLKPNIAQITGNIGTLYSNIQDFAKSREYSLRSRSLYDELGMKQEVARLNNNLGSLHAHPNNPEYNPQLSESYLREAMAVNKQLGTKNALYKNYLTLAELCEQEQRWQESLEYYKQYHLLEKDVHTQEVRKNAELFDAERKNAEREKQLALAKEREHILNNILPEEITARLITGENPIADHFDCVSVMFMDLVGFTKLASMITAQQLVYILNIIFTRIDAIMREYGLEKIKTIGDAYMAVAGAPIVQADHAVRAANAALKLLDTMNELAAEFGMYDEKNHWMRTFSSLRVRIGLHCGPIAAGIVGENKFLYDLWGDAVNTASRMESHGEAGKIHCTGEFVRALSLSSFQSFKFIERGEMDIKGKGTMKTYFMEKK